MPACFSSFLRKARFTLWIRYLAAAASAFLMASAFPPYNFGWIAWFGLVPFFLAIQGLRRLHTYSIVATWSVVFFAFMIDLWILQLSYILVVAIVAYIILQTVLVSELQLLSACFHKWGWLLFCSLWVGIGYLFSFVIGLFNTLPPDIPFFSFANTQWLYPAILQITPIVGEYGLALLIVLFNRGLVQAILNRQRKQWLMPLAISLALLIICISWGTYRLSADNPNETVGVALIPSAGYSAAAETDKTRDFLNFLDSNPSLPNGLKIPEIGIVAWSEWPAGDLSLNTNPPWVGYFYAETHKYLVTCFSKNREEGGYPYSVAVVFDPDGSLLAQNAKRKTAPILERMSPGEADTIQTVVDTPWGRMSTLICYDTLFPEVVRREVKQGVDFIIVPANAVSPVMPRFTSMHLCQTIFRAAENHTAIAFCYSGGESALIDANGKVLVHAPFYTSKHPLMDAAVAGGLPVGTGGTLYTKIGELFIWMVLVVCLVFLAVTKIRKVW